MPLTFSLETYAALFSAILMSLRLPSTPPPYNHTQSSYHDHSLRKNMQYQDLLVPVAPSVLIHIPSPTCHSARSAYRRKRKQSIPMVEIVHQKTESPQLMQGH
ncbi:hypothetical protein EV424DRAFT_697819 [Suillus variegatus]|nr:hypothetical protein EV424DRAFT_697819 [Suillus variegatus]